MNRHQILIGVAIVILVLILIGLFAGLLPIPK